MLTNVMDLALVYESIYDAEDMLLPVCENGPIIAEFLADSTRPDLTVMKQLDLSGFFVTILNTCEYSGYKNVLRLAFSSRYRRKALKLDSLKAERPTDCEFFLEFLSDLFGKIKMRNSTAADNTILFLEELPLLRKSGIIVASDLEKRKKTHIATSEIFQKAVDLDIKDKEFLRIANSIGPNVDPFWTAFWLNGQLLDSSYLGMPLHLWKPYLPLLEYKYIRGGQYAKTTALEQTLVESYSTLVPRIYCSSISDLIKIRNSKAFKSFRSEILNILSKGEAKLPYPKHIMAEYLKEIEELAATRSPKLHKFLFKSILSMIHPIIGLVHGGVETYKEYVEKYKKWRLALAVIDLRREIKHVAMKKNESRSLQK